MEAVTRLDETIPGGVYEVDGVLVDAWGKPVVSTVASVEPEAEPVKTPKAPKAPKTE